MDFTREPIIESVITPRDGCTLVVRSSKGSGQEEYFVDALEVVIFGHAIFFRSRERPKAFLVPATDYEVLEVRETRLVLKNVGLDRSIKIAGGREAPLRTGRDAAAAKAEKPEQAPEKPAVPQDIQPQAPAQPIAEAGSTEGKLEGRIDKKRDRRRNYRRRRGRDDDALRGEEDGGAEGESPTVELPAPNMPQDESVSTPAAAPVAAVLSSLLAPPPNLISETIARYKDNALFKGAFFMKNDEVNEEEGQELLREVVDEVEGFDEGIAEATKEEIAREEELAHFHKVEPEAIELPNMSLDYPVYVPADNFSIEEEVAPTAHPELFEGDVRSEVEIDEAGLESHLEPADEVKQQISDAEIQEPCEVESEALEHFQPEEEQSEELDHQQHSSDHSPA